MKKIFSLLTTTVLVITTSSTTAMLLNINTNNISKTQSVNEYSLTTFENVIKIINSQYSNPEFIENNETVDSIIKNTVGQYYLDSFNNKTGEMLSFNTTPKSEEILKTWDDTYTNKSPNKQTYPTQEYTKEVENTKTYSISLREKIAANIGLNFKIISIGGNIEIENGKTWTETEKTTETLKAPSFMLEVNPYSIAKLLYTITEGTYETEGTIHFKVSDFENKIFNMPRFYFNDFGDFDYITWNKLSVFDAIQILNQSGYSDLLKLDSSQFSVFSIDDIKNPKEVYVNLPISWISKGGKINITNTEEPLSKF